MPGNDVKVSGLPQDNSIDGDHYVVLNDPSGPTTKRGLLSILAAFFFNQVNIPAGSGSPVTRDDEIAFDHVNSGCVWSGDSYGSNRNASMTAGVIYINGRRLSISAVSARTFTASKDTYIDVLDNQDGTGTLVYTEVANNAASPALAANSIRIGIIITAAGSIANVGSVNQGQEDKVLPIASSIPYAVTDSLGNLICNRNPSQTIVGYRQIVASQTFSSSSATQVVGLSVPILVPTGRKVRVTFAGNTFQHSSAVTVTSSIWDGTVGSGTQIAGQPEFVASATASMNSTLETRPITLSAGLHTINAAISVPSATGTLTASTAAPRYLLVELL